MTRAGRSSPAMLQARIDDIRNSIVEALHLIASDEAGVLERVEARLLAIARRTNLPSSLARQAALAEPLVRRAVIRSWWRPEYADCEHDPPDAAIDYMVEAVLRAITSPEANELFKCRHCGAEQVGEIHPDRCGLCGQVR